jgi:hypothetical protein
MANDPKYVRLPERLLAGNVTDIEGGTGWGISGLDVKEFPEDPDEASFVRDALRSQLLEPATAAEFKRVSDAHARLGSLAAGAVPKEGALGTPAPWNEAAIQQVGKKVRNNLLAKRLADADEEEEETTPDSTDYASLHKAELVQEIERRNAEREDDDQLPTDGTKDDLVKRLQEDDAAVTA